MPGVTVVQSNFASAGTSGFPGSINLPCSYTSPNGLGNIGLCVVFADDANIPASLTDTNFNKWYLEPPYTSNIGNISFWVCPSLKAGANTVTANAMTISATGGPTLGVIEILPPPCPLGGVSINAFNPHSNNYNWVTQGLIVNSEFNANIGVWYHTLFAAIFSAGDVALRTFSITPDPNAINASVIFEFDEPVGTNSGAVAFCTVPYPFSDNSIQFLPSPTTPIPVGFNLVWLLMGTQS